MVTKQDTDLKLQRFFLSLPKRNLRKKKLKNCLRTNGLTSPTKTRTEEGQRNITVGSHLQNKEERLILLFIATENVTALRMN